ncbi:MAG: 1-acyl-sn-glycerol-3-phosphate acyltransferase [Actinomycetota bacterium]|nr:1-acyl-sn-glycerol-3-phosphate acyltransferase [Actinomycetota bacterium]
MWSHSPIAAGVRAVLQRALLFPLVRWLCRPLTVLGREGLGSGPYVFVANHCSHADTALILSALPAPIRRTTAPAAAEDYFFRGIVRRFGVPLLTGAFPFPRRGTAGLARARALLSGGWSVLLFPEGTRSSNGALGGFRPGAGALGMTGATIVPVGLAGPRRVLPKGARLPRQTPVAIAFGAPVRAEPGEDAICLTERLHDEVARLVTTAESARREPRRTWFERAQALAQGRAGMVVALLWGVAEGIAWPVVPDFVVAPLALAAPRRFLLLAGAAVAGSVVGGSVAHALGSAGAGDALLAHVPLVTERMTAQAGRWLDLEGPHALLRQPLSGIPYKVFAYQAPDHGVGAVSFALFSALARGGRLVAVSAGFAGVGLCFARWRATFFGVGLILYALIFFSALAGVVRAWS